MVVFKSYLIVVAAVAAIPSALAQLSGRPAPSDPAATVPPVRYESAFRDYVPHREPEIASWRDINDAAARIGGHAGALRQPGMHGGQPPAGTANSSPAPSPVSPHMPRHGNSH